MRIVQVWITRLHRVPPERFVLLGLLALAAVLWLIALRALPRPLEVTALAVGEGDAFLIRAPSGKTVLIDGGSRSQTGVGERVLVPSLLLLGVRRLDALVITHPDSDHLNGLPAVMEAVPVGVLLDAGFPSDATAYRQVLETAQTRGIAYTRVHAGDRLNLGPDCRLDILAPAGVPPTGSLSENDASVVCLLSYRRQRMLFTGDLEEDGEGALLARNPDLRADILKVAHHGSRFGSGDALLNRVAPAMAVISCSGDPSTGHPHAEVLARLRKRGVRILRTDVSGQIQLSTFGREWRVRTYRQAGDG